MLLTRLKPAATLRKETRQLRNRLRNVPTELFAIEFELPGGSPHPTRLELNVYFDTVGNIDDCAVADTSLRDA